MLRTRFFLKTRSEVKVTVIHKWYKTLHHPKMHSHTKIGIPISNNIRDPDTIIIKTMSEVKVTVTQKWYVTLPHPKMHIHTEFGIPISKNIENMHRLNAVFKNQVRGQVQGHSDPIMVPETLSLQDASTHQI